MDKLVEEYIKECKKCDELPEGFVELIKHNFLAKFVCYDKDTKTIEIGVEEASEDGLYPNIKVMKYPLSAKKNWVKKSFKDGKNDLTFYGHLLNNNKYSRNAEVVVM